MGQSSAGRLRGQTGDSMESKLILIIGAVSASGQLVDDFTCPDEFVGFYPHLISCDKYWHCQDGYADLKTCGNGLGFLDTDDTFTLEQCAELHLVECGDRTEIEPPISTAHRPRLFGTYAEEDPECADYYGDLEFDARELSKNGFNSRRQDNPERVRSGGDRLRNTNTIQRTSSSSSVKEAPVREVSRPAPPALQAIVDTDSESSRVSVNPNRGRPSRPQSPSRTQFRLEPVQENEPEQFQATLPPRLSPVRIQSFVTTPEPQTTQQTQRPSRLDIVTDRPNFRTSFRRPEPSTTVAPTSPASRFSTAGGSRFSTANRFNFGGSRFQPTQAPTTTTTTPTEPPQSTGLPDPVKAAPGPNGEEYYYYYYYYDDDEAAEDTIIGE